MAERKKSLLVIDDDKLFCDSVAAFLGSADLEVTAVHRGDAALAWCGEHRPDVVLLDQKLPDTDGIALCKPILAGREQAKIVFITAYPSFDHAVRALRSGAHDYLSKPLELEELKLAVDLALKTGRLEQAVQLQDYERRRDCRENILVGIDGGLKPIRHLVELAAGNRAPVLITGETGTGKNVVAKSIHYLRAARGSPFVGTNCAALPETLIESELFGHEKGAFTGAAAGKKGIFEMADGGTLFLDEIGELPLHLQAKLLGVLDDGRFRRLGGQVVCTTDVRVIAATNVDLEQAIARRTFRHDLYYRMSVMRIHLPPLRERKEDIRALCRHFLRTIAPDRDIRIDDEQFRLLEEYHWPGNVRELKNIIERAVIVRDGASVRPARLLERRAREPGSAGERAMPEAGAVRPLAEVEKEHIRRAMAAFDHNRTRTAKALGVARSTLIRKLEQYGM